MFGTFDWVADVVPGINDFMSNGLVRGALIASAVLYVSSLAGRKIMGIFH